MLSCSSFGLPIHAQPLCLFVATSVGKLDVRPCKRHAERRAANLDMESAMHALLDLKMCGGEGFEGVVVGDKAATDNILSLIHI